MGGHGPSSPGFATTLASVLCKEEGTRPWFFENVNLIYPLSGEVRYQFQLTHSDYKHDGYNNACLGELFVGFSKYPGRSKLILLILSFVKSVNYSTEQNQISISQLKD